MANPKVSESDLRREITDLHERFPRLSDDDLFLLWFLRAYVTDNEDQAAGSLVGGPGDKSVDAVFLDENARIVFIVQGKYRRKIGAKAEARNDVLSLAQLAESLWGSRRKFAALEQDASPEVQACLSAARERLKKRKYSLRLYYVTLGRCSKELAGEAERFVRGAGGAAQISIITGSDVLRILSDYLDGVAPPVPSLDLEVEAGHGSQVVRRYDRKTGIGTWVFPMTGKAVKDLYTQAGIRLFARNVRGFLGNTDINRSMEETLNTAPEYFWYYNNGITMICDDAEQVGKRGRDILRVANPQVINGQQTTRVLAGVHSNNHRASVLVRVIHVPRKADGDSQHFENLVSSIVKATNWQNMIRASDLMSNDRRQVEIQRELRKVGYHYIRKRMTKGEARRATGGHYRFFIKKEELATAVAGCEFDPAILRRGRERLFEEQLYQDVFPNSDPDFYLPRYWLMRAVTYSARGYPERAYAKWLVQNFVWSQLRMLLSSQAKTRRFRQHAERSNGRVIPLTRAINSAFDAALRFFRRNRGTGARAIDVSTFFQRRELHKQFEKFWRKSPNRNRRPFNRHMAKVKKLLAEEQ